MLFDQNRVDAIIHNWKNQVQVSVMKQSKAFHKGIRRVWSRLSAGSGTSRPERLNSGGELKDWCNVLVGHNNCAETWRRRPHVRWRRNKSISQVSLNSRDKRWSPHPTPRCYRKLSMIRLQMLMKMEGHYLHIIGQYAHTFCDAIPARMYEG